MDETDEVWLDRLGTAVVLVGLFVVVVEVLTGATAGRVVERVTPLLLLGFAAILGGGTLKMYLQRA